MQSDDRNSSSAPWYRHRWTWGLMLGPAIVLVAGAITMVIAVKTDDGLVARDYYKRGLMINKILKEQQQHNNGGTATDGHGGDMRGDVHKESHVRLDCARTPGNGGKECRNG